MVDDDRAQLVLIGAVAVSVAILGAVVLLNTVHSSPDAIAETDARSVDQAQEAVTGIEDDLEAVAANRSFDRPLRFVDSVSDLQDRVDAYERQYLNLTTRDTSELVSIEYNSTASRTGEIAYNESLEDGDIGPNTDIITGANDIQFYLNVSEVGPPGNSVDIRTNLSPTPDNTLTFETSPDEQVTGWGFDCNLDFTDDTPFEVVMIDGEGEIRSSQTGEVYCTAEYSQWDSVTEIVFNPPMGNPLDFDWEYEIVGFGGSCQKSECFTGVVGPAFDVAYQNPNTAVDSTIILWGDL